jgi:hypothetical protein
MGFCARIADQLPRDGGRLGHAGRDLDPRRREIELRQRPELYGVVPPLKDRAKQRLPAFGHKPFDAHGDLRRRVFVELEIVFKIPSDPFRSCSDSANSISRLKLKG